MHTFLQDIRYALRTLRNSPGFAAVAIITLALGIGANTAIFTIVNSVLLRPLPYPESDRIVFLTETHKGEPGMSLSYPNFLDWESQNKVFESVGAVQPQSFVLTGKGEPQLLLGRNISSGFFPTFGIKPALGRDFLSSDDQPSATPVALISYRLWQKQFGGRPDAIGSHITLDQKSYVVIGVAPRDFVYRDEIEDVFVPIALEVNGRDQFMHDRSDHPGIYAVARLKPGVTMEQARADMDALTGRLAQQYPESNTNNAASVRTLRESMVRNTRPLLTLLFASVGLVLLIACANVANLLLSRAAARSREIAIRTALGAGPWRLLRQVLTESVLLGAIGGLLGTLIASFAVDVVLKAAPDSLPRVQEIHIDSVVFLFALITSVATGILFGLVPAFHILRVPLSLSDGGKSSAGSGRQKLRNALVVSELALSLVLLAGAGLLIRSFARLLQVDPGLNPTHVLTARIHVPESKYKTPAQVDRFFDEVLRRLQGTAGVESAAANTPLAFSGNEWDTGFMVEGGAAPSRGDVFPTYVHFISPEYLRTMEVPLVRGRNFSYSDNNDAPLAVLINQTFAKKQFPNQDPVGKRVRFGSFSDIVSGDPQKSPWYTIIGVVGDVKQYGLDADQGPEVFFAFNQHPRPDQNISSRSIVLRSSGDPIIAEGALRRALQQIDKDQPIAEVSTMEQLIATSVESRKTSMFLLIAFAGLALLLAGVGIYGVLSYWVLQRTREIGIRMALGAARADVIRLVADQGGRLVVIGLISGLVLAFPLAYLVRALLFGVHAYDPATFAAVAALLAVVAALSCYLPARRATKLDPIIALRNE